MSPFLKEIRNSIAIKVYAGFESKEQIIEGTIEDWQQWCDDDDLPGQTLRSFVELTTAEFLQEHREEQAHWPAVTDCDRLDAAFAELDRMGIIARQNYEQTLTSGCDAIRKEAELERARRPVLGYVFYHNQDTETAVCCDGTALAWGALEDDEDSWRRVAETIIAVIKHHSIRCEWRGKLNCRIFTTGMHWQRRR
jgi:hypothetical protein